MLPSDRMKMITDQDAFMSAVTESHDAQCFGLGDISAQPVTANCHLLVSLSYYK